MKFKISRQRQNGNSRNVDLKIRWTDKVSKEDVVRKVNQSRNILNVLRQQKCRWIGHDEFLQKV